MCYFAIICVQNGLAKIRIIETTKQYIAIDSIIAIIEGGRYVQKWKESRSTNR